MSTSNRSEDTKAQAPPNQEEPVESSSDRKDNYGSVQAVAEGELPTPLQKLRTKQIIFAVIDVLVVTLLIIHFKTPQCAFFYVIGLWLVWQALTLQREYSSGEIVEIAVVCQSTKYSLARKLTIGGGYTRVIFTSSDDEPEYYRFNVPGQPKDLDIDSVYVIYFKKSEPNKLLTYVPV